MKKTNKFKLTPEASKMIEAHIKNLPKFHRRNDKGELMYRADHKWVMGVDLLKDGITENKFGEKILPKNRYLTPIKQPMLVNHSVNLVKIWQQEGQVGVDFYVKFFMDIHAQNIEEAKKSKEAKIIEFNNLKKIMGDA